MAGVEKTMEKKTKTKTTERAESLSDVKGTQYQASSINNESSDAPVATTTASTNAATCEDATAAAHLAASNAKPIGRPITTRYITAFADKTTQANLMSVSSALAAFCDIPTCVELANEGINLIAMLGRLDNSCARVRQRVVQVNKELRGMQATLVDQQGKAAPSSAIAKALKGIADMRENELVPARAKRTRKANKKGALAGTKSGTPSKGEAAAPKQETQTVPSPTPTATQGD